MKVIYPKISFLRRGRKDISEGRFRLLRVGRRIKILIIIWSNNKPKLSTAIETANKKQPSTQTKIKTDLK